MRPAPRPQWQQATALITIGAGSVATGLTLVPKAAADLTTPASVPPVTLLALEHANAHAPGKDAMLRAAIVHMARHFLRLAQTRSPAEMEAMIWQYASTDGANHGPSCAAFASLTLELGSHIAGLDSWVTGGTSYPWPVHAWADGRVDPNPASPGVVSVLQDAHSHGRWHPLGDGYAPQAGDWVLFDGHVEVVTKYHGGVLHTIGGDSLPNMSVNAHEYSGPLQDQGVTGFVDNGAGMSRAPAGPGHAGGGGKHGQRGAAMPGSHAAATPVSSADPSSAGPAPQGAASGGAAHGGAAGAPASSAGPVTTADASAQQPQLAPRAIPAPPAEPRSRYAQESRALPAQGARPAARAEHGSGAGATARTEQATRTAAQPQRPGGHAAGKAASPAGRAARPADPRPKHADPGPGHSNRGPQHAGRGPRHAERHRAMTADVPATGLRPARPHHARPGEAAIPGLFKGAHHHSGDASTLPPYHRHDVPPSAAPQPGTTVQQTFIKDVANGAMATQEKYGVPASVTIAQAIDESGWGQSLLATSDHNLFGIKGTGPAGSDVQPTQEVINGQLVNLSASFQIYENIAQSMDAHGRLLAHSGDYASAMSHSKDPNAFAAALTGVYATDPNYGAKLIQLMKQYDLYRFDRAATRGGASGHGTPATHHGSDTARRAHGAGTKQPGGKHQLARSPMPPATPGPRQKAPGRDHAPHPKQPGPVGNPVPVQPAPVAEPAPGQPDPIGIPVPGQPGPVAPAHDAKPAHGTKTGAGVAAPQAGTTHSGQADHGQTFHHDVVTPPTAVLYPGRSARPGPLAHPARPADLARPSTPGPGGALRATSAHTQAQQPGQAADPAPGQGSALGPANTAGDAAIPGVPHGVGAQAGSAHAHRPIGRLRPAHPNGRPATPTPRARGAGPAAPGQAARASGGAQPAAAGGDRLPHASPAPARTPDMASPGAAAPTVSQAGSAMIPGLQHHGPGAREGTGLSAAAAPAPDSAATGAAPPGGSSIPGAQQGAPAGSISQASASPAAAPSHSATTPASRGTAPSRPVRPGGAVAAPTGQPTAPGHAPAGASHSADAPGLPAAPGHAVTTPAHAATAPAGQAVARGHATASSDRAAPSAAARPSTAPAPAPPTIGPADPGPAAASHLPPSANPAPAAPNPMPAAASTPAPGGADVPGLAHGAPATAQTVPAGPAASLNGNSGGTAGAAGSSSQAPGGPPASSAPSATGGATLTVYHAHMPPSVREAFVKSAKTPLIRSEHLYRDVASHTGIRWELLAACDWMQCKARHGYSPVYGEKLGTLNPDDTCYRTKSAALEQCASDLVQLARSVYQLDIATSRELTIRDLANVFAAFRWGGLLRQHCTSAMDFPYSVAGLTADHTHMRWPNIDEPNAPDKPGSRFRQPFGAVPVVLGLNYQALM